MVLRASLYLATVILLLPIIALSDQFDLVHAQYLRPQGLAGVMISKISGKPLILTATGTDVNLLAKNYLARIIMRDVLFPTSARIVAVSHDLFRQIEDLGGKHVVYIPNYVAKHEDRGIALSKRAHNLLFVGTLEKVKNLEVLIRAFREVVRDLPDSTLTIAGLGPMLHPLEQLSISLGLEDRVSLVRYLSGDALSRTYEASQIFVLPSIREGLSVSLLEAMSFGLGIVVSETANSGVIENKVDGLTFRTGDVRDLAEKIRWLFTNPSKLEQMANNAKRKCSVEYSLETVAPKLESTYREVLLEDN
jgi:glycosyltransferase involved in cell wall biosynthesis